MHTDSLPEKKCAYLQNCSKSLHNREMPDRGMRQKIIDCSIKEIITQAKNKNIHSNQILYRGLYEEK